MKQRRCSMSSVIFIHPLNDIFRFLCTKKELLSRLSIVLSVINVLFSFSDYKLATKCELVNCTKADSSIYLHSLKFSFLRELIYFEVVSIVKDVYLIPVPLRSN